VQVTSLLAFALALSFATFSKGLPSLAVLAVVMAIGAVIPFTAKLT
jgi:hypothetical protein